MPKLIIEVDLDVPYHRLIDLLGPAWASAKADPTATGGTVSSAGDIIVFRIEQDIDPTDYYYCLTCKSAKLNEHQIAPHWAANHEVQRDGDKTA